MTKLAGDLHLDLGLALAHAHRAARAAHTAHTAAAAFLVAPLEEEEAADDSDGQQNRGQDGEQAANLGLGSVGLDSKGDALCGEHLDELGALTGQYECLVPVAVAVDDKDLLAIGGKRHLVHRKDDRGLEHGRVTMKRIPQHTFSTRSWSMASRNVLKLHGDERGSAARACSAVPNPSARPLRRAAWRDTGIFMAGMVAMRAAEWDVAR